MSFAPVTKPVGNRAAAARTLLHAIAVIAAVGVVGIADHVTAAALAGAALLWLAVLALRRERRIRTRLADPRTRPAPRRAREVPLSRVGPGEYAPGPPARTRRPGDTAGVPVPPFARGGSS